MREMTTKERKGAACYNPKKEERDGKPKNIIRKRKWHSVVSLQSLFISVYGEREFGSLPMNHIANSKHNNNNSGNKRKINIRTTFDRMNHFFCHWS